MAAIKDLLGAKVLKKGEETVDTEGLCKGKVIGLYFSAHWCPPCKGFTPVLAEWYKKSLENGRNMDIIFVSSDRDKASFDEYYAEMPWHALPFDGQDDKGEDYRKIKGKVSSKFKVQGIPTLVFLDGDTGEVLCKDGRGKVTQDKGANDKEFPWPALTKQQVWEKLIDGKLIKNSGDGVEEVEAKEALEGKVLGLYFSASWCGPCVAFTPKLVETYNKLKAKGKNFEIVFIGGDRDDDSHKKYFKKMSWFAMPFEDSRCDMLNDYFEVEGIPTFVILDEAHQVITDNGRGAVGADPEGEAFPWHPKPLNTLEGGNMGDLNDYPCFVYLTGGKKEVIAAVPEKMEALAKKYMEDQKADPKKPEVRFFYEGENDSMMAGRLRQFASLEEGTAPKLVLINIPETKKYQHAKSDDLTDKDIEQIIEDFKNQKLEMAPLRD